MSYTEIGEFILRTPLLPFLDKTKSVAESQLAQESIYLASPVYYRELIKWEKANFNEKKKEDRLLSTLTKYVNRMSTRCTPFGLFSGVCLGKISENTDIKIKREFKRKTKLSLYVLNELSNSLLTIDYIRYNIKYYTNSTIYSVGKKYRYIEYKYDKGKMKYQIVSIEKTSFLNHVIKEANKGTTVGELIEWLIDRDIPNDIAVEYVNNLIDNQVILSVLRPTVTGENYLDTIINILESIKCDINIINTIRELKYSLNSIDEKRDDTLDLYEHLIKILDKLNISIDESSLFHVDMLKQTINCELGENIISELKSTLNFLENIYSTKEIPHIAQFKKAFNRKFEEQEIPILLALDPELGIRYPVNATEKKNLPLINDLKLPNIDQNSSLFIKTRLQEILLTKTMEVISNGGGEIILSEKDFDNYKSKEFNFPRTLFVLFEIIREDDKMLIRLDSAGGSSGVNLISRFAELDKNIEKIILDVTDKEKNFSSDKIHAEIVHLVDARIGNLLYRPHLRDYELVYLTNSTLSLDKQIPVSDLMLSLKNDKFHIRSKKLNKEIIPILSNAHNYMNNPTDLYQFLCDIQFQHKIPNLGLDWGYLDQALEYKPRVMYKNTILSVAEWKIRVKEITPFFNRGEISMDGLNKWRLKKKIPIQALLADGDNLLYIDFCCKDNLLSFFGTIKNRESFLIKEFLYKDKDAIVKDEKGNSYLNEIIVPFIRNTN